MIIPRKEFFQLWADQMNHYMLGRLVTDLMRKYQHAPTARGSKTGGTQQRRRATMKKSPPGKGNGKGGKGKKPCLSAA